MNAPVKTTCPYCGVGCGILASRSDDGTVEIKGDPEHPANFGRLCSKGSALAETLSLDDRLLNPIIDGRAASWDAALDRVAQRFRDTIAEHGPDSVAFYVSGQILTEDYYIANKLMKGFIGSANIDTNSRLCMASSVAGHRRAFGTDTVPGCYEDLEEADLVVLVGSNLAWCHPVLYQRLAAARSKRGTRVVVIDPRRTATCEIADMHLGLAPGTDVALFNGLLLTIAGANATDKNYIARHTTGFRAALDNAMQTPLSRIARTTGVSQPDLLAFYDLFISTPRVVTVFSQGVNQATNGTDKVNAIVNCHLATGRIGKPGMGPFSVTGQPNAMGGREVGGLANMLAAHMNIEDAGHRRIVQEFWRSPAIADKPGLKAVDMFKAVGDGRIKALWVMATNPVDSLPEADRVRSALEGCPFVVVSDVARHTDTTAYADVLLPSLAWGEKDGTVTNSERTISRQRAFLDGPGKARADWWQLAEVARRMGFAEAFAYSGPTEIFAEHARLSAASNDGTRDFDIGAFSHIEPQTYDALAPVQWPQPQSGATQKRFFGEGGFYTPDGRARFIAGSPRSTAAATTPDYPLRLNTGRVRDQWHTMTRTGKSPRLMGHVAEPFVEIHPRDARTFGLEPAALARIESPHGVVIVRVCITDRQRAGEVFAPIHWTDQLASAARIDALVSAAVDPISGQPGLKETPVRITPFAATLFAVAVTRDRPAKLDTAYWALAPINGGWRVELATADAATSASDLFGQMLGTPESAPEIISYSDAATGQARHAAFAGNRLVAALYTAAAPVAASRTWLSEQLAADMTEASSRLRVLAGRAGQGEREKGPIVCACFSVGRNDIAEAITRGGCLSVDAVGGMTSAGTNCGSCRAEIGQLLQSHAKAFARTG